MTKAKLVFQSEGEFRTRQVIRIAGDWYDVDANGGHRGAWQNRPTQAQTIDATEARRIGLEMGYTPEEIAAATEPTNGE